MYCGMQYRFNNIVGIYTAERRVHLAHPCSDIELDKWSSTVRIVIIPFFKKRQRENRL